MTEVKFLRKNKKSETNNRVKNILTLVYMLLRNDTGNLNYFAEKLSCKTSTIKKYIEDIRSFYDSVENSPFSIIYDRVENKYKLLNREVLTSVL